MSESVEIRLISSKNLIDVTTFVIDVFMEFEAPDYSQEGIKAFLDTAINNKEFMSKLAIYVAHIKNEMVGVIATRDNGNHIALFFVDGTHQRQGIGRKLFETVLRNSTSNEITVNSSPYAKDVYHHLGFEDTDIEQTVTGIRFTPMIYRK